VITASTAISARPASICNSCWRALRRAATDPRNAGALSGPGRACPVCR
jgi:hypothetical protein